nr:hypothetical protein CPGR_03082 [Mycolicibacterium malmesburyense]
MREGQQRLTGRHGVEDLLLLVAAQLGDQAAGDESGLRDGFGREAPADLGQHDHHLDLARLGGVEPEAEDADLGELAPHLAAPARFGFGADALAAG